MEGPLSPLGERRGEGDTHPALYPLLRYVNQALWAWAMRKFKRFKGHKIRAGRFLERLARDRADLFIHWHLVRLPDGSRVRREFHARLCERLVVKFHRPTQPLYCTRNRKGNFKVGLRTSMPRLQRSLFRWRDLMRRMRHLALREQIINLNIGF